MMSTLFVTEHVFDAPVKSVWKALTTRDKMKEWYFSQIKTFEPAVGFKFEFANDGSKYQKEWIVTEVIEEKKLAHTWAYIGFPGISEVIFKLEELGNKTRLTLSHSGLENFPNDPQFDRYNFEFGWNRIIGANLKIFLENSKD